MFTAVFVTPDGDKAVEADLFSGKENVIDFYMMKNVLLIVVSILFITTASAQENRIKVACIGNSITYGYGLPDRTTQSYPAQLQKMLGESYQVETFGKVGYYLFDKGHRAYIAAR